MIAQTETVLKEYKGKDLIGIGLKICTRCIYDETVPKINFDDEGVCNYCKMIDEFTAEYKPGTVEGEQKLIKLIEEIKRDGQGKKYDVIIGVSGGTDSSYMVHKAIEWGLRPLAVHYDNTWNTAIATENIRKVLGKLKVDLYTYVVNNKESDDIFKSFFLAGVPELDGPTDIAYAEILNRVAHKFKVKYTFEGHSFIEEGISPLGSAYTDGKYIKDIHGKFGKLKMKTFPNMTFSHFMFWTMVARIKRIRPLWYIHYSKKEAQEFLQREYNWEYYGGHHLENRMTAFNHSYYFPVKFNIDQRNNTLSALVRNGLMPREEALRIYGNPPFIEPELVEYFKKRLELSEAEFIRIMLAPPKSYLDYKTYKKLFERLRPLFYVLYKSNLVYKSFYKKYCFPQK